MNSDFSRRYKNKKPVVLRGALSGWAVLEKWTPPYLASLLPASNLSQSEPTSSNEAEVEVFISTDNRRFSTAGGMTEVVKMASGDLLQYVFSYPSQSVLPPASIRGSGEAQQVAFSEPRRVYLRTHSLPEALFSDIATPLNIQAFTKLFFGPLPAAASSTQYSSSGDENTIKVQCTPVQTVTVSRENDRELSEEELKFSERIFRRSHMQLWLGTQGNTTPLHYDRNHGLLAQIHGCKRIELFSHADTSYLYPDRSVHHLSRVNLADFDCKQHRDEALRKFPKFEEATRHTAVLMPGDVLYIPPFWWHEVVSLDNALSRTLPWDLAGNEEIPPIMLC